MNQKKSFLKVFKRISILVVVIFFIGLAVVVVFNDQIVAWLQHKVDSANADKSSAIRVVNELAAARQLCIEQDQTSCDRAIANLSSEAKQQMAKAKDENNTNLAGGDETLDNGDYVLPDEDLLPSNEPVVLLKNLKKPLRIVAKNYSLTAPAGWTISAAGESSKYLSQLILSPAENIQATTPTLVIAREIDSNDFSQMQKVPGNEAHLVTISGISALKVTKINLGERAPGMEAFALIVKTQPNEIMAGGMVPIGDSATRSVIWSVINGMTFK